MAEFLAKIDTTIMGRKTAAATAEMRKSDEIPESHPGIRKNGAPDSVSLSG